MKKFLAFLFLACSISAQAQDVLKLKVNFLETTATEKVYNFVTENLVGFVGWQFQMEFDGTKMKFKEIRNALQENQSTNNFNESSPGLLRTSWVDLDLISDDYPDSTVLFQLVFDLLDPEGSPLCFLSSQDYFEFIIDEGAGDITLAEILISDDCYQGFSIFFGTTSTSDPSTSDMPLIKDAFLSTAGSLSFTSNQDQALSLSLLDVNGKIINSLDTQEYGVGRHTVEFNNVIPGVYLIQAVTNDGREMVLKVSAHE